MAVSVRRNLDRTVAHLFLHVSERSAVLDQLRPKRVPQVVKPDLADACPLKHRYELAVVKGVGVENAAIGSGKN
jgi:hypothetical protein